MKKEELIKKIYDAFHDVADNQFLHPQCKDDMNFDDNNYISWADIEANVIEYENETLCIASPEFFQFLLPAYMTQAINNAYDSNALDPTISSLNVNVDFQKSKFQNFTEDQKKVIINFLEYCIDSISDCCDVTVAQQALVKWKNIS